MATVGLHIIRAARGWRLQNVDAKTLATFRSAEAALENAQARARHLQVRGLNVRVMIHHPGKAPDVIEYAGQVAAVESYALSRCCLT